MIFKVRMIAFETTNPDGTVKIREVDVPDEELTGKTEYDLELIFKYGQNDFQSRRCCSVSVGDVVDFNGELFVVAGMGYNKISPEQYGELWAMDQRERSWCHLVRGYE